MTAGGGDSTHSQIEENIKHSFCRDVLQFLTVALTQLLAIQMINGCNTRNGQKILEMRHYKGNSATNMDVQCLILLKCWTLARMWSSRGKGRPGTNANAKNVKLTSN